MKLDGYTVRAGDVMWDLSHGKVTVISAGSGTVEVKTSQGRNVFYEKGVRPDSKNRMLYWSNPVLVPVPKDEVAIEAARAVTKTLFSKLTHPS